MEKSHNNLSRYARNISVECIGEKGQKKLLESKVLIVGCGALGSVTAMYLAGAGVGNITIADFDTIDISNLQRQVFYRESDCGKSKARTLAKQMKELNSEIEVETLEVLINETMARHIFNNFDFIIDATDNPASKFIVDRVCEELSMPCCIGGVSGFNGQVSTMLPGSIRYRTLFDNDIDSGVLPCSLNGVVGPSAGIVASIQASEAIKHLTGCGETLMNKLLVFDLLTSSFNLIRLN